jgi:hypothetical protein
MARGEVREWRSNGGQRRNVVVGDVGTILLEHFNGHCSLNNAEGGNYQSSTTIYEQNYVHGTYCSRETLCLLKKTLAEEQSIFQRQWYTYLVDPEIEVTAGWVGA